MSTEVNVAKQAIHDKIESQIKIAEAKLNTLQAQAKSDRANLELKAIGELRPKKVAIQKKFEELKKTTDDKWEQTKTDLEGRIADFEKSVKGIESRAKAS